MFFLQIGFFFHHTKQKHILCKTDFYILANRTGFFPVMVIFNFYNSVCSYYPGSCGRMVVDLQLPICNQCLSPLTECVRIPLMRGVIDKHYVIKFVNDLRGRWFYLGTLVSHQQNWPPWYNWNIVESGAKHHNPNPLIICNCNIVIANVYMYRRTLHKFTTCIVSYLPVFVLFNSVWQ